MRTREIVVGSLLAALALGAARAHGQATCPCPTPTPEPAWKASVGAGLSLTGGNTNTDSYNLSFALSHDPKRRNLFKAEGLYLRTEEAGEATADKTSLSVRDEYKFGRAYLFGAVGHLRDPFKDVEYLIAPAVGAGFRLVDREGLLFSVDGSIGGAFEKLEGRDGSSDLALSAGERLEWQASKTLRLFEKAVGLWKTDDFSDSYYRFELGLAAALASRLELKLTFLDDYKSKPAAPGLKKNDTAFVAAVVFKM
jgi:putative salt-induced outer membrane protein YdiY